MSRSIPSNGQNLRLAVVLALAALAIGSTLVSSTSAQTADVVGDAATTTTSTTATDVDEEAPSSADDEPTFTTVQDSDEIDVVVVDGGEDRDGAGVFVIDADGAESVMTETTSTTTPADTELVAASCPPIAPTEADEATAQDDAFFADDFSAGADAWDALSGRWEATDGGYRQTDDSGFDLISQLRVDPPETFRVSVTVQSVDGSPLGGGLILGQPIPADRSGATIVDFTDGGRFLRWGRYDDTTAQYTYVGGVAMSDAFDPAAPHRLTVDVRGERTLIAVDGVEVGMFEPLPFGRVGLVTSQSAVSFDDLRIEEVGT